MSFTYFNDLFENIINNIIHKSFENIFFSEDDLRQLQYVITDIINNDEYIKYIILSSKIKQIYILLYNIQLIDYNIYNNLLQLVTYLNDINKIHELTYIN